MEHSGTIFLLITVTAVTVLMTRLTGTELISKFQVTPRLERFLETMAGSVVVAFVATEIVRGGIRTIVAVIAAGFCMWVSKNGFVAMLTGMGCAAVLTFLFYR